GVHPGGPWSISPARRRWAASRAGGADNRGLVSHGRWRIIRLAASADEVSLSKYIIMIVCSCFGERYNFPKWFDSVRFARRYVHFLISTQRRVQHGLDRAQDAGRRPSEVLRDRARVDVRCALDHAAGVDLLRPDAPDGRPDHGHHRRRPLG